MTDNQKKIRIQKGGKPDKQWVKTCKYLLGAKSIKGDNIVTY